MNFLMRSTQTAAADQVTVRESTAETHHIPKPPASLEALIAEDPYPRYSALKDREGEVVDDFGGEKASIAVSDAKKDSSIVAMHSDVSEEEGWITIPYKELSDNWSDAPDIKSLCTLDRSFVFPGEQVHILACLSACKKDTEIITPFKVAAVMSKNGMGKSPEKQNGNMEDGKREKTPGGQGVDDYNGGKLSKEKQDSKKDVCTSESLLRLEDHKRRTEMLLQRFEKSHYFVRIAESGEPLWSKKSALNKSSESSETDSQKLKNEDVSHLTAVIDKGNFNPTASGGVARNTVKCCSLSNGDIVVLLQVNVGVDFLKNPVLEILQFEKYNDRDLTSENQMNITSEDQDPCGELLKWLLPLDNTLPPPSRPLSPPLISTTGFGNTSQKSNITSSSGSQLFSFGNFRSYSMSSLPQNSTPPPAPVKASGSKPSFDPEDWDQYSSQKLRKSKKTDAEELLSFRGVSLERERFSVCCGLEGIYMPGRRWMRKLEIIQPVEIHSFAADCNTDDLLCVQIKNVTPAHAPDIVVYIGAITIVFEEASKGGQPLSLPIACIEAGADHSLPNLALRRGEEHSFILKPTTSLWRNIKANGEKSSHSSQLLTGTTSSLHLPPKTVEGKRKVFTADQYAIMVSCQCNYTESRLFFKQPTSWRPRISRDLMISVASEMSGQHRPNGGSYQLPVQVLTLQASNLTSEDLTLTVLAPASFTSPPSVLSLNSSPTSPRSPFVSFPEITSPNGDKRFSTMQRLSSAPASSGNQKSDDHSGARSASFNELASPSSDVIPSSSLGCTHLWLQSRVPLGCVPSHSTATIKLELLPLTDGIITLDTLQIDVKEKVIYMIYDLVLYGAGAWFVGFFQ
ncbi:uncharacterized protein LOC133823122 isoform X2 [Humulus lupulus]|uniref:uncharacterized protein LOC133823122 isoform X2 n=1 Tax=Humulus lupulus TaxID=3486 RepID=UPI002B40337E|nr:uncharacterized protein LOC133823122 isoform X2 [Humulus lupulus]